MRADEASAADNAVIEHRIAKPSFIAGLRGIYRQRSASVARALVRAASRLVSTLGSPAGAAKNEPNRASKPSPTLRLILELLLPIRRQPVELRFPPRLGFLPFGG